MSLPDKMIDAAVDAICPQDFGDSMRRTARGQVIATLEAAGVPELLAALVSLLAHYRSLVESGDCGNWDPNDELVVKAADAAIAKATS